MQGSIQGSLSRELLQGQELVKRFFRKSWGGSDPSFEGLNPNRLALMAKKAEVLDRLPGHTVFKNVFYVPEYSCLYTKKGVRIDGSCFYRGRGRQRRLYTLNPKTISPPATWQEMHQPCIYVGEICNHFGHFLTESISRLWYAAQLDDLPLLYHPKAGLGGRKTSLFNTFLEGVNLIDTARLVRYQEPILLRQVILPEPSFSNRSHAFRIHAQFPENFAENTLSDRENTTEQPLYFSRTQLPESVRSVIGERELEAKLRDAGFMICYPEQLPLSEQVRLINKHKVVVGAMGSALHGLIFDISAHRNVIYLAEAEHINPNYLIFDAVKSMNSVYIGALSLDPNSPVRLGEDRSKQTRTLDVPKALEAFRKLGLLSTQSLLV